MCGAKVSLMSSRTLRHVTSVVTCQGVTTFREFWAQSAHFWQNGSARTSLRSQSFLCGNPDDLSATLQRPIFTKFGHETYFGVPLMNPKDIFENFYFKGHLPPKSEIESRSNRHLTQSRLQVMGCTAERYCTVYSTLYSKGQGVSKIGQVFCTT